MTRYHVLHRRPALRWGAVFVLLANATSCGPRQWTPTEEDNVLHAVSNLSDASADPVRFRNLFAEGAAPDESQRARYRGYMFIGRSTEISGDTATVTVELEDQYGQIAGRMKWSLVRAGEQWKIKNAPLP